MPIIETMTATEDQPAHRAPRPREPRRRTALLGVNNEYVDALEHALTTTRQRLATARAENEQLTHDLDSAHAALDHSTAWSERLPAAVRELASLAAGRSGDDEAGSTLAAAILALAGEELLASVEVSAGEPAGELRCDTHFNDNGRPVSTIVRLGGCVVDCTWQPAAQAGPDTANVVEGLCEAVVCSLAAVATARSRRDVVTQLADERSLRRHLALRERLGRSASLVRVVVDKQSAVEHRELFGRLAWSAALADAANALERIATQNGGQAYQASNKEFHLLVDADRAEQAHEQAETALVDCDGLIFDVDVAEQ
jgi:hypothetical protein